MSLACSRRKHGYGYQLTRADIQARDINNFFRFVCGNTGCYFNDFTICNGYIHSSVNIIGWIDDVSVF